MSFYATIVKTKEEGNTKVSDDKNSNDLIKWKKIFVHIVYIINCVLFPPAKPMFILWTIAWINSFPKDNDMSFGSKVFTVIFGYFLMCGISDLIYLGNKKRYLQYKIKIKEKKVKRLRKIMHETNLVRYESQFGYGDSVQNKGFLKSLFHKEPSAGEKAQERLQRAKQMASIVNTTYDFEEFINSYKELIKNMEFLKSIENCSFFTGTKPSEDLAEIKEKRPLTEKEFIDRYFYQYGKESLESNKTYFNKLLPETVQYINSFLDENVIESKPFDNFDNMEGHDFEYFCADILKRNSFENVEVTQGSGDHGIDILAEKDGITYAIQCKRYSSNIGNAAIQQAYTGKGFYHKDIAVVLTNRYFTAQAKEEAKALGVKLWDRDKLNSLIKLSNF